MRIAWNKFWNVFANTLTGVDNLAAAFGSITELAKTEAETYAELSDISRVDRVARERLRLESIALPGKG